MGGGDPGGRFTDYYPAWLVTRNAAGHTQHIVAGYRPLSSLQLFSRLLSKKFAGTPIGEHFLASES